MLNLRIFFTIIIFVASYATVCAQYMFRLVDTSAGLPDNEVKALFWTPDGRLGVRTSSSLSFFDGQSFHSVPPMGDEGYATDYVASLPVAFIDAMQRVWLKEPGQTLVFDMASDTYIKDVKKLLINMGIRERVRDFYIDSAKDYWFITASGKLLRVQMSLPGKDAGNGKPTYICKSVKARTKGLRDVCFRQGKHWFLYEDGWALSMNGPLTKVLSAQKVWQGNVPARDFLQFAQDKHQLWLMWNHGVATFNASSSKWQPRYTDDKSIFVTLCTSPEGTTYVGIRHVGFVAISRDGKLLHQADLKTLDGETLLDDIQSIAYHQGNLMLGLAGKGMFFHHPNMQRFTYRSFADMGLRPNGYRISNLAGGQSLLTCSNGVYALDAIRAKAAKLPVSGYDCIRSMQDSKGRIWTGSFRQGFFLWDGAKMRHFTQGGIPAKDINYDIVRGFLEDDRHRIWVNFHGGIGLLDEQKMRIVPLADKRLARYKVINEFKEDREHRLWMASTQGLFVYSIPRHKVLLPEDLVSDPMARTRLNGACKAVLIDRRGLVWVGTLNGLCVINTKDKSVRYFGRAEGMSNEMINGLVEDVYGNVWATTPNGLCRFQPTKDGHFKLMVFDGQNKLGAVNFGWMTVGNLSGGNLFFGTQDGYYVVKPAEIKEMKYTGHPILTSLSVNNQEILAGKEYRGRVILPASLSTTDRLVLRYNENYITVKFSGLNFDMPSHTLYKYRLKGMSDRWVEISPQDGAGSASFTDLTPGEYELEVYSAGIDNVWSKQMARLLIVVEPPFWATWWAKTLYVLLFAAVLVFVYRWKIEQNRKRMEDEKYRELEDMKYRFFTNISHEFRTLLTLIITPIGSIMRRTADEETRSQLAAVSKNAGDLLQLVNQLLDFRKMEMNGERLCLAGGNIDEFVKYTTLKFTPLAEQKDITLRIDNHAEGLFMLFDRDKTAKILNNLLSNAFKYTDAGGSVTVTLSTTIENSRRYLRLAVTDTGCGISEADRKHLFERFFRSEHQGAANVGSGIGLNMVAEYVRMHDGRIDVESQPDKGSSFIVLMPTDLHGASADKPESACDATSTRRQVSEPTGDATILVVEDNDEFRNFMVGELSRLYNKVLSAHDGIEGALLAEENSPDIVVSDVMMPRMNGVDMCRRIKENLATSHIPVILLTAWSTDETRKEGYRAGADAYIAKPFDMEMLVVRINNLLEKRDKQQRDFSHNSSLDVKTIANSTQDEEFLQKIIACIEKNISNGEYTIDTLARDVLMSRMSLYRKMKSLTGQTPADFIRMIRLKSAAKLLKTGQCNVSEACWQTGFASPQNFTKHFKEMFGVLPSQYL